MNVILSPGIIPYKYFENSLKESNIHAFFVVKRSVALRLEKENVNLDILRLEDFAKAQTLRNPQYVGENYDKVYSRIADDHLTMELEERTKYRKKPWQNNFNSSILISNVICNCLDVIGDIKPKFVFFHSTPHSTYNWILGRTAEVLGIPVYCSRTAPIPWRSVLTKGIKDCELLEFSDGLNEKSLIEKYIQENKGNYDDAIPSYEKERLDARKGNIWSWRKELKNCIKKSSLSHFMLDIFTLLRKHQLYVYYQGKAKKLVADKYVVVFLHYQPERTSLPEGLYYSQQYHLLRALRLGLPNDVAIYVKEHPSTFMGNFDIRYRSKMFYDEIEMIENTHLVDLGVDSFTLMARSVCVVTITGTVGVQALIRGKSVMAFGNATYKDAPDCYRVENVGDVEFAYSEIVRKAKSKEEVSNTTALYLLDEYKKSISGLGDTDMIDAYDQNHRISADGRVLSALLLSNI